MFKIYLSRTVGLGVGIYLPATIEEIREAYSLLNGMDTVPLESATAYVESSIPNLHQYLYEVPVSEKRLEELNYLAYRVKWMDSLDEAVFGTVIAMMKPETLQDIINLSCNMAKFRYLPGVTTVTKLGEYLLNRTSDIVMEEQAAGSNYEWVGKDYIKKYGGMFHTFGYTSRIQEDLDPIYVGKELPDLDYKQTCSFKVWLCKGNPYDYYTLTLPAMEGKMDVLKSVMGISNWSECEPLSIQCREPARWEWLSVYGSIEELNDLVTEHCQSMENRQASVLEM